MKRSIVILLHLGFYGCLLIITMVILGVIYGFQDDIPDGAVEHTFLAIFYFGWIPTIITFNAFYFFLFPKFMKRQKYVSAAVYGFFIALGAALLGYFNLYLLYGRECIVEAGLKVFLWVIFLMTSVALVSGMIAFILQGFLTWMEEIKLKDMLRQKNQEMEMALVKAQLDPHFLFNTLNNIDVLILKNAKTASDYLNKLSDIMRFMLFETKTAEIPLTKEIEYIEKYIALQKIRTSNSNYVKFDVSGKAKKKRIAPMVFIPFIENAFKHTNNKKLKDAININIQIEEESVTLKCENKFDPDLKSGSVQGADFSRLVGTPGTLESKNIKEDSNGLGNELIQKRLELIYPGRHILKIIQGFENYIVHLTIQNGTI